MIKKNNMKLIILALTAFFGLTAFKALGAEKPVSEEIHVSADSLISVRNSNYAEFQGNVVTVHKGATMYSDRLRITYKEKADKKPSDKKESGNDIDKIIATGHVKIVFEDKTAWSDSAVYTKEDDCVVLSGGNPKVVSGKNVLTGDTIKINRTTEELFANGAPKLNTTKTKRVEATFFPDSEKSSKSNTAPPGQGPKKNNP
jgi:lipopolysaccharide transport protein LptA